MEKIRESKLVVRVEPEEYIIPSSHPNSDSDTSPVEITIDKIEVLSDSNSECMETNYDSDDTSQLFIWCPAKVHGILIVLPYGIPSSVIGGEQSCYGSYLAITTCNECDKHGHHGQYGNNKISGQLIKDSVMYRISNNISNRICERDVQILVENGLIKTYNLHNLLRKLPKGCGLSTIDYMMGKDDAHVKVLPWLEPGFIF